MPNFRTGASTERKVRAAIVFAMFAGFAGTFLRDGYGGYARQNVAELIGLLGIEAPSNVHIDVTLTAKLGREIAADTAIGVPFETVVARLGQAPLHQGERRYFIGPGGYLRVRVDGDRVDKISWQDGPHSESDQAWQRSIGFVLACFGFVALCQFLRVLAWFVVLSEDGLKVPGSPLIPVAAITALDSHGPPKNFKCTITYTREGQSKRLELDSYTTKELAVIVAALVSRCGLAGLASGRKQGDPSDQQAE